MLILVRHGRTALNAARKLQGRIDEPLDEVGREQARRVAALVGGYDELISNPLLRATQTAAMIGDDYAVDERWVELSYGVYEGVPHADTPSEVWGRWRDDPAFVPEGGESLAELDRRVRAACEALSERARETRVVVVSHVSPIKAAVAWALGASVDIAWRSHLDQASICRIDIRSHGPVLITFNETPPPPT